MKQRIFELGKQATIWCCDNVAYTSTKAEWDAAWEGKFAELLIRECAKVAFDDWCEGTNESSSEMAILKHFGVEYERQ